MADGKIVIETGLDTSGIKDGISKIESIAGTGLKVTTAAIGAVSTALMGAGGYAVKVGSDFESAMSKVEAISGATAEQMDALTQKAKDMGASTKFSATESAEAFQYMAMAGWDSAQMIDGIGGIMNLAAADGLDLATTSDIVTDALTAFGLAASDSTHFADVLATASSNANTNVAMLGESFKYVAPVAGAMNYSVEDVSKALGLMANASVKGSMAGTTLKTSLARMAAPTDKMAQAMEKYCISLTDSEGNMKSLDEVMKNLRKSLGGLSEDEQTAAASTIFGKEAMAGMLAIVNASEENYNKLSDAIANADGTAQRMADTMNDNLQGKVTLAKSALEGLGIQIYETMEDGLKEAVETGTGYIDRLADAFTDGGLEGAVNEAGDIIADLATKIAESAPDMIKASTKLINSFVKGIVKNKKELKNAAKEIVKTLVDGLISLLPKQMQKPVKEAADAMAKSFESGGLKKAINTICNMLEKIGSVAINLSRTVLPALTKAIDFLGENIDTVIPLLTTALTAIAAFKVANTVVTAINALKTAVGALFTMMSAHPIGLVAAALAGLIGYIEGCNLAMGAQRTETQLLNDELHNQADAVREAQTARKESVTEIESEYGYYQKLWDELKGIVDQNGNIMEGYEERAKVITTTLSEALGTEIENNGKVITNYGELRDSIDQVIQKKKAEAIVSAYEDDYVKAKKESTAANKELARTYDELQSAIEIEGGLNEELEKLRANYEAGEMSLEEFSQAHSDLQMKIYEAQKAVTESKNAYKDAKTVADEYKTTLENYDTAFAAVESGSDDMEVAILALTNNLKTATSAQGTELAQQVVDFRESYEEMKKTAADGGSGVTEEAVAQAQAMYIMSEAEFAKTLNMPEDYINRMMDAAKQALSESGLSETAMNATIDAIAGMEQELDGGTEKVGASTKKLVNFMTGTIDDSELPDFFKMEAKEATDSMSSGIEQNIGKVAVSVGELGEIVKDEVDGAIQQSTSAINEGAPVLLTSSTEYFNQIGIGASRADFENAIAYAAMTCGMTEDEIRNHYPIIAEVSQGLADSGASGFTESDLSAIFGNSTRQAVAAANQSLIDGSTDMMASGSYVATSTSSQYVTSMKQGEASVVSATKSVTNAAGTTLRNSNLGVDSTKQGTQITQGLNTGIKNGTPLVKFAVLSLGNQTKESLKSVKLQSFGLQEGNKLSSGTASGIRSSAPQATSAASSMGNSAKNALENVGLRGAGVSVGLNFARGFENGIRFGASGAINAAASMARQSLQVAKNELDIHSPSRKTEYVGKMYSAGAEKGIEKNQNAPISAAKEMAKNMIGAMDVSAAFSGMRAAMNYNVGRFASRVLVSGQITGEANNSNNISDKELKAIGEAVAEVVNDRMEEFKFVFRDRELGRAVREVQTT